MARNISCMERTVLSCCVFRNMRDRNRQRQEYYICIRRKWALCFLSAVKGVLSQKKA